MRRVEASSFGTIACLVRRTSRVFSAAKPISLPKDAIFITASGKAAERPRLRPCARVRSAKRSHGGLLLGRFAREEVDAVAHRASGQVGRSSPFEQRGAKRA